MHGDSFFASGVDPGPKTNSANFGVKAEPPALPCRDDVVVKNGTAAPKSCLSPLEMRTTVAYGLLPTGETSTAIKTTSDYSTIWFCQAEETHFKRISILPAWYHSNFREINYLPSIAGGSLRRNLGKIGCSIQVVLKVVSVPPCFWERGAR